VGDEMVASEETEPSHQLMIKNEEQPSGENTDDGSMDHIPLTEEHKVDAELVQTTQELKPPDSGWGSKETLPMFGLSQSDVLIQEKIDHSQVSVTEHQSTGVFEPTTPRRHLGLSIALVSAIALIVFITLNPQLLSHLLNKKTVATRPAKITLGAPKLQSTYRLTSNPKAHIFNRLTGEELGITPFEWKSIDPALRKASLEVRSKGYLTQIVSLSGFMISPQDSNLRELNLQLKPFQKTDPKRESQSIKSSTHKMSSKKKRRRRKTKSSQKTVRDKQGHKSKQKRMVRSAKKASPSVKTSQMPESPKSVEPTASDRSPSKPSQIKVPELPNLSPSDPVDTSRFKNSINVEKLP
jgi:hypothetical protein